VTSASALCFIPLHNIDKPFLWWLTLLNEKQGLKWFASCRFDDLVRRFERPDGRNRWDSQLFEINPSIEEIHEGSQAIVKAVAFLSGDRTLMGLRNSQVLQPTIATQNVGC
jgi:tRNA uridine 5-carbamoylmethylation protein Kti12